MFLDSLFKTEKIRVTRCKEMVLYEKDTVTVGTTRDQ